MAVGPKRPRFYLGVLIAGFLVGGLLSALMKQFLPASPTLSFFTYSVAPSLGPIPVNLLVISFTVCPCGLNVSILSLIGVAVAYYAARSLF